MPLTGQRVHRTALAQLKCEDIYLRDYAQPVALERGVGRWFSDYNHHRIHQALAYARPLGSLPPKEETCPRRLKR